MIHSTAAARASAALIAVCAWTGLIVQAVVSYGRVHTLAGTAWRLASYYTVLTNLAVAILFTGAALGLRVAGRERAFAGTMLNILLVGITYGILLRGLRTLTGHSELASVLLHDATPALVPLFWLLFVPKGRLGTADPWRWAAYPTAYLAYALLRGAASGHYVYPFIDITAIGWWVTAYVAVIALLFLLAGWGIVLADRVLARWQRG